MPKRKAPEATSTSATAGAVIASKKSKGEALAAAQEWHDRRNKSGVGTNKVVGNASPSEGKGAATKSATISAQQLTASKSAAITSRKLAITQPMPDRKSSLSPLFKEAKSSKSKGGSGGNHFLQSLRKEESSSGNSRKEAGSSESTNGTPSTTAPTASDASSSNNLSAENDSTKTNIHKRIIAIGEAVIFLCLLALNVAAVFRIYDQQLSNNNFQEQHVLEVEKLKAEISKSREVEAVLRLGINVLEQPQQVKTEDLSEVPSLYGIQIMEQDDMDLQSPEEKNDWLEGIRLLTVAKHLALDDLDVKLVDFGVEGVKEKIRTLKEGCNEGKLCNA